MTIAFDYLNDSHVLLCFFKVVSRSRRSLEEHPPLADLRQVHFSLKPQASCKRAILKRSDPLTALRLASAATSARE
jgi:hypothetical protein